MCHGRYNLRFLGTFPLKTIKIFSRKFIVIKKLWIELNQVLRLSSLITPRWKYDVAHQSQNEVALLKDL